MSRIGKEPITIIKGTKVETKENYLFVEGSKGKLSLNIPKAIKLNIDENKISVHRLKDDKLSRSLHGTIRVLINNMIIGVNNGFKKELEIVGVGYKVSLKGKKIVLNIGFSHPLEVEIPEDIKVSLPSATKIVIEGADKQKVGEFAARIRRFLPPEPYKGKGIRYVGEQLRRKAGKSLAK